jgi:decaprenyl-phosphate phosphoribosyltransferase
MALRAIIRTARPRQWVKQVFVAAPVVFARHLTDPRTAVRAAAAFALFSALSSSVYFLNDVIDVERDRAHPQKKDRPIAAGQLSLNAGRIIAATLAALSLAGGAVLSLQFAACALGYFALNLAYSFKLKHVVYVDVLCISAFFLLRTGSGALAIGVEASSYLLVCTALLSLFLGFGKRLHELLQIGSRGTSTTRSVLASYRAETLTVAMWITGTMTLLAYVMYTRAPHTLAFFGTERMILTAPFVAFGLIRFVLILRDKHSGGSPTDEILHDWPFMLNLVAYAAAVIVIIYYR